MPEYGSFGNILSNDYDPDIHGKMVTYNPALYSSWKKLLGKYNRAESTWLNNFGSWKKRFTADTPQVEEAGRRDIDNIKYFRDGGFAADLKGIDTRAGLADNAERKNLLDFAGGSVDRARLNSGVNSSADFARRLKVGSRIEGDFAHRATDRERASLGWVNQMKQWTVGRAQKVMEDLNNRILLPQQLSDSHLNFLIDSYSKIAAAEKGASPVFWEERSTAQALGDMQEGIFQTYYGSGGAGAAAAMTAGSQRNAANGNPGAGTAANGGSMMWNLPESSGGGQGYGMDAGAGWGQDFSGVA